jgi:hypothetical protein
VAGAGLPGASEVAKADWIEVKALENSRDFVSRRPAEAPNSQRAERWYPQKHPAAPCAPL